MKQVYQNIIKFTVALVLLANLSHAQDFQLTQFYASPLLLNPGFAGATGQNRATLHNRVQWTGLAKPYRAHVASFDHSMPQQRSGIGVMVASEVNGTSRFRTQTANVVYSHRIDVNSSWSIRPGLQFGVGNRRIDYSQLVFGDQIYERGLTGTQEDFSNMNSRYFFDVASGVVVHNSQVWIGFSAHHLNRPDVTFVRSGEALPIRMSVHGGAKINLDNNRIRSSYKSRPDNVLIPSFNYKQQGNFRQLDLGMYWNYEPIIVGAWYRGIPVFSSEEGYPFRDAVAILVGTKFNGFYFGYSYDFTVSRMEVYNSGGAHELSISYVFPERRKKKPKKRRDMIIPCPDF
ncbi:type IX secretion system membrane protein PorP/SprF [Cytophagaceae bacterium ABcell3]|nr:type IX secretion system membrane protein PorP/SprF [Cytophagaceae bacterium ABcell3]